MTQAPEPRSACEKCGKKARPAGPIWVGPLTDVDLLRRAKRAAEEMELMKAAATLSALLGVDGFPPWSLSIEDVCSRLGVATVPESAVYRYLRESGYDAMRTPFERSGVKTDANCEAFVGSVEKALKSTRAKKA